MHVCVITTSRRVGKVVVDGIFYGVAVDEAAARKHVLDTFYNPGTDPSFVDDDRWRFETVVVEGEHQGRHGRL